MRLSAKDFINLENYPISTPGPMRDAILSRVRSELELRGCAVLKGFLKPAGIAAAVEEAAGVADKGHRSYSRTNAYFTKDDESLPAQDPRRRFFDRSNAFIPADNFHSDGPLRTIFDSEGFDTFIRECLQEPEDRFFRYADPLADAIVNAAWEGNGFPWHFDTNNYTVTLALQNADSGGAFEYAPMIRSTEDENFDEVVKVLDGTSDKVISLKLEPGDLQLFKGRYSLHRVAPLEGTTPRYVAIFSYVQEKGMVGTVERALQLYGKTLPIHHERAGQRADALID
ncbi:MAG: HalD/BesD family halogenase [Rhizobiaceae bacterium]